MTEPFLDAVFKGARFHGSELPVEMLEELTAYRELLLAVARRIFLNEHQDRKRVPKGFIGRLNLKLTGISDGSTIATLARPDAAEEVDDWGADTFVPARELIGSTIEAVNSRQPIPDGFPH